MQQIHVVLHAHIIMFVWNRTWYFHYEIGYSSLFALLAQSLRTLWISKTYKEYELHDQLKLNLILPVRIWVALGQHKCANTEYELSGMVWLWTEHKTHMRWNEEPYNYRRPETHTHTYTEREKKEEREREIHIIYIMFFMRIFEMEMHGRNNGFYSYRHGYLGNIHFRKSLGYDLIVLLSN